MPLLKAQGSLHAAGARLRLRPLRALVCGGLRGGAPAPTRIRRLLSPLLAFTCRQFCDGQESQSSHIIEYVARVLVYEGRFILSTQMYIKHHWIHEESIPVIN